MEKRFSKEQLNNLDKDFLITLLLNMQEQLSEQTQTNIALRVQVEKLTEQITIMNTRAFGRKSETIITNDEQLSLFDDGFNEAEAISSEQFMIEPEMKQVIIPQHTRKKRKGKREEDLSGYPTRITHHTLSEEELKDRFPEGYDKLPDEIYRKLEMIPASFEVHEHHIAVYKGKNGKVAKAEHPKEMLNNSIATPSLVAAIIHAKYTNGMPLYRQEQDCARNEVNLSRQTMANWVITASERYLSLVYDKIKEEIKQGHIIHADETPVMVTKDGRKGMHKNYMWVYRTGDMCKANPAVLYDYQKTRKADAPRNFLKGFKGKLVCDGYQVYHALENESDTEFQVAGCWAHARRPFAEIVKSLKDEKAVGTVAHEALIQIQNIYHTDNSLKKLPPSKRRTQRKVLVKPLVDHYFEWAKDSLSRVPPSSATTAGIKYSLNQEKYLKTFLTDPEIPLDNNLAEQAIRPFCVGKKNWKLIDTVNGAKSSAMLYSIVETAKANELNIYQYFKHLLTEIPKHMDDTNLDFLDKMLPWSKELPEICHKKSQPQKTK